jgi:hypothetical protein
MAVLIVSREGSHYLNRENLSKNYQLKDFSFFDTISREDRLEEIFGIYGPYGKDKEYTN